MAGVLADVASAGQLNVTWEAAAQLGLELVVHTNSRPLRTSSGQPFTTFARGKAEAMVSLGSSFFVPGRELIPELALRHRLPSVLHSSVWADSGRPVVVRPLLLNRMAPAQTLEPAEISIGGDPLAACLDRHCG